MKTKVYQKVLKKLLLSMIVALIVTDSSVPTICLYVNGIKKIKEKKNFRKTKYRQPISATG